MPSHSQDHGPFARKPEVPASLHPLGREILAELTKHPESKNIILGGGVALQHYLDLRPTADLDAWWLHTPDENTRGVIAQAMARVAEAHGLQAAHRHFGETDSFDLIDKNGRVFAFQIARRSIQLDSPLESAWPPVKIETLRDNVAAKMNALVDRGAPRDFVDIHNLCERAQVSPFYCWRLWGEKNPDRSIEDAVAVTVKRLEEIEFRRPLTMIHDESERLASQDRRRWFRETFCQVQRLEPNRDQDTEL